MGLGKKLSRIVDYSQFWNPTTASVALLRRKYLSGKKVKGALMKATTGKSGFSYSNSASGGYTPRTLSQLTTR